MESIETPHGNNGNGAHELAPDLDRDVQCAAAVDTPVLICAEFRTGEQLARQIHDRGARAGGPFVVFPLETTNAAGSLRRLLSGQRPGAETGTVLIRDIDRAPMDVQRELCEAIGRQARCGTVPMRIIAATTVWLVNRVNAGLFDERLFYRLNTVHIRVGGGDREARVVLNRQALPRPAGRGGKPHGLARGASALHADRRAAGSALIAARNCP